MQRTHANGKMGTACAVWLAWGHGHVHGQGPKVIGVMPSRVTLLLAQLTRETQTGANSERWRGVGCGKPAGSELVQVTEPRAWRGFVGSVPFRRVSSLYLTATAQSAHDNFLSDSCHKREKNLDRSGSFFSRGRRR